MLPCLKYLVNRFRPRDGWALLSLTLFALLCPPAALIGADDELRVGGLLLLTVVAVVAGLWFVRARLTGRAVMVLGGLLGLVLVTIVVGRLVPPLPLLWREIGYAANWLRQAQKGQIGWPFPFASAIAFSWLRLTDLGIRLGEWSETVFRGEVAQDPIAFLLLTAWLAWACALFATWQIYRRRAILAGLLPTGLGIATIAFFRGGMATFYLIAFLFFTLWLLAVGHLLAQRERWDRKGTDYPGEMGLELLFTVSPGLVLILLLAAFFPVIHPRQIRDAFWKMVEGPWSTVEHVSEQVFGPIDRDRPGSGGTNGVLPREHLLGGKPEAGEAVMFFVTTNDPAPPASDRPEGMLLDSTTPRRYWRSVTYQTYTGHGWTNGLLEQRTIPAGQRLAGHSAEPQEISSSQRSGFELHQHFNLMAREEGLLVAANAPVWLDQPVQGWWRGPGDLVQLTSNAAQYTVVSLPPRPSVADLRAASPNLPPGLAERYLAVPKTVPRRVLDLAQQVAGGAETRYDRAHAIEIFLRNYPYTLELPATPHDRDLVDYFLFGIQKGYCDYYASAMVVMAREVGVPARLATGYAQGTYDRSTGRWVVTEKDGHSWVEVYFDGIGWVEFEPTAGQAVLVRFGGDQAAPVVPPMPRRVPRLAHMAWMLLALGAALVVALALILWTRRPRQLWAGSAADLIRDRYARLIGWGTRLRQPPEDGQTALEYGTALKESLQRRSARSPRSRVRQAGRQASPAVEELTEAFVRAQYSSTPLSQEEGRQIHTLWNRLRRYLWWVWLGGH